MDMKVLKEYLEAREQIESDGTERELKFNYICKQLINELINENNKLKEVARSGKDEAIKTQLEEVQKSVDMSKLGLKIIETQQKENFDLNGKAKKGGRAGRKYGEHEKLIKQVLSKVVDPFMIPKFTEANALEEIGQKIELVSGEEVKLSDSTIGRWKRNYKKTKGKSIY